MTKAVFKFDLFDPDDKQDFLRMSKALDMAGALWDISQRLRETHKYNKDPITSQEFYEILNAHDIKLDELYS